MTPITSDEQALAVFLQCAEVCKDEGLHGTASRLDSVISHLRTRLAKTGPAVDGWLPIESAPNNGDSFLAASDTRFFILNQPPKHAMGRWTKDKRGEWMGAFVAGAESATHWRPLPEPPTAALEARG